MGEPAQQEDRAQEEPAPDEIDPADVDPSFVPRPKPDTVSFQVDDETVLIEGETLQVRHLDRIGTLVWACFDGTSPISEIVDDLAEGFGAPHEVIEGDVLTLVRSLGAAGTLVGIVGDKAPAEASLAPEGVPVGTDVGAVPVSDVLGEQTTLAGVLGRRTVLVNWSDHCGFCDRIAPALAEASRALAPAGVEVVLLAYGSRADHEAKMARLGLDLSVLLRSEAHEDEPFESIGTPSAYLLDGTRTASGLALGADAVPSLLDDVRAEES